MSTEREINAGWERLAKRCLLVLLLDHLDKVSATIRPKIMRRINNVPARYPQ